MSGHVRANLWLVVLSLLLCCVLYPLAVLGIARVFCADQAEGSLIGAQGQPVTNPSQAVGSRLIAQPFTADEYFQPRPSAVSYNAAASGASNWGANNYLLRDRVARQLGPIVKYRGGPKKGQLVGPDIESWFQNDQFQGRPGLVSQWAQAHSTLAQNWVKADKMNGEYVAAWQKAHPDEMAQWIKDNPDNAEPKPEDLAVPFFTSYATTHPGTFPGAVEHTTPDGPTEKKIEPVKDGKDIQSIFFDMWRQDHPEADLEPVPADMVMASGSGLDPDITLKNALYQLDRVAAAWAQKTSTNEGDVRQQITTFLNEKTGAPLGGLAGVKLVNVLEMNLALRNHFEQKAVPAKVSQGAPERQPAPTKSAVSKPAPSAESTPSEAKPVATAASSPTVATLAERLDQLQEKVEAAPDVMSLSLELKGLKDQVAKLAVASGFEDRLNRKLGTLEEQVTRVNREVRTLQTETKANPTARLDKQLLALNSEVDSLREAVKKVEALDHAATAPRTKPDLTPAVKLFQEKKYAEALGAFRTLTRVDPDDARTWYYAALASGFASGQWRGETEELVGKGVERERAGTPTTAEIDEAFAVLAANGRDWLAFYRRRISK